MPSSVRQDASLGDAQALQTGRLLASGGLDIDVRGTASDTLNRENRARSTRRLCAEIATLDSNVVVEASAGSGKTALLDALREDGVELVVIDEVDLLSPHDVSALALGLRAESRRVVLAGRIVPVELQRAVGRHVVMREPDLWLTTDEVIELVGGDDESQDARRLADLTEGWPVVVAAAAAAVTEPAGLHGVVEGAHLQPARLGVYAEDWFVGLTADQRWAIDTLLGLGRFDERSAHHLAGEQAFELALRQGMPVFRERSGWMRVPSLARTAGRRWLREIAPSHATDVATAARDAQLRRCLAHLDQRGELARCIDHCLEAGRNDLAIELIEHEPRTLCNRIDPHVVRAQLVLLDPDYGPHPNAAIAASSVGEHLGDPTLIRQPLERALEAIDDVDPALAEPAHQEVAAELAFQLSVIGDLKTAEDLVRRLAGCALVEGPAAARLLEARAGVELQELTTDRFETAQGHLTDAVATWRLAQRPTEAARSTLRLASVVLVHLGQMKQAGQLIDRALADNLHVRERTMLEFERARILMGTGQQPLAEQTLRAAASNSVDDVGPETLAHIHEALGELAAQRGDLVELESCYRRFSDVVGEWRRTRLGVGLLGEFAVSFARVGARQPAIDLIAEIEQIDLATPQQLLWYRGWIAALTQPGPETKELIEEVLKDFALPDSASWMGTLLVALASRTDRGGGGELLAAARAASIEARGFDQAWVLAEFAFTEHTSTSASPQPTVVDAGPVTRVRVLGGFGVERGAEDVHVPLGHQATLVKFLVLSRGYCTLDAAIDALWPDVDLATGRKRLRNVINRVRTNAGEIITRDGELLRLGADVESDIDQLRKDTSAVIDAEEPHPELIRSVHERLSLELLPTNRYDEWLEPFSSDHDRLRRAWAARFSVAWADGPSDLPIIDITHV